MGLSKEKQAFMELSDQDIKKVMRYMQKMRDFEEREAARKQRKTDAYSRLQEMIGLEEVKKTVDKILAMHRLQKVAILRGRQLDRPTLHMQMVGAPGTAKTTVARLLAEIYKENGICKKNEFVEAGRADLISDHVGGTAIKTRELCRKANGGVLFIDEAYSFKEEGNSYMGEFLSTLIAEMENSRNELIVIFAGYRSEMNDFMEANPGLRSRVPFEVEFPDYTVDELILIADHIANAMGFEISESVRKQLARVFSLAMGQENFGNGRYVRNVIEQAVINKALKFKNVPNVAQLSDEELFSLNEDDFVDILSASETKKGVRQIGFHV